MLCAIRLVERCAALRRSSGFVCRGCRPAASLDSRRLADRALVAAARSGGKRGTEEPDLCIVQMENSGQSAAQPDTDRTAAVVPARLDRAAESVVVDSRGAWDHLT